MSQHKYEKQTWTIINDLLGESGKQKLIDAEIKQALLTISSSLTIEVSNRMTRSSGSAEVFAYNDGSIDEKSLTLKLSKKILDRATDEEVDSTIRHELAHLIDFCIRGKSDHSLFWKNICLRIGGSGSRCHRIDCRDLSRVVKRYVWSWYGDEIRVTAKKHKRLMTYRSKDLSFVGVEQWKNGECISFDKAQYAKVGMQANS